MAAVSISTAITGIGGVIMWFLNLRKIRLSSAALALEIDHVRADTERIRLEIQKLTDEQTDRDANKADHALGERIVDLARGHLKRHPIGHSVPFSEEDLISQLNETPEAIRRALAVLREKERARFTSVTDSWIIQA